MCAEQARNHIIKNIIPNCVAVINKDLHFLDDIFRPHRIINVTTAISAVEISFLALNLLLAAMKMGTSYYEGWKGTWWLLKLVPRLGPFCLLSIASLY